MSVETKELSVTTSPTSPLKGLRQYDVLIAPDLGGRREENSLLDNTITIVKPVDRISTPTEPQKSVKPVVSTIYFNTDSKQHLDIVRVRERQFDSKLGINSRENSVRSYDVVHDRVNFELAKTSEKLQVVRNDLVKEGITNLRERYDTFLSVVTYVLGDDSNAFSEDDPYEPVDVKFQRGASYRINDQHSPEPEREQQTVDAGIIAKKTLADPKVPMHSKVVVILPASEVKDTIYMKNFVDIYESDKDPLTGQRIIKMYRFASASKNEDYKEIITKLKPDLLEVKGNFDIWCLSNPIFIDSASDKRSVHEFFHQEFRPQAGVIKEEEFQEILTRTLSVRQNYIDVICGETFNPREIAMAFNAVLNKADAIREEIIKRGKSVIKGVVNFGKQATKTFNSIKDEVAYWGYQLVKTVMAGCGLSSGFSLGGGGSSIGSFVSRAISGIFSGFFKDKDYCINCGACGQEIKCVVRKGESCPKCQAVRQC